MTPLSSCRSWQAGRTGSARAYRLVRLGLTDKAIEHQVGRGRLHRVHRGVYSVGHRALSHEARLMAAVLLGGGGAVLSHRAAAARLTLLTSCLWPEHRLLAELDGHATHPTTRAFERDRSRDRALQAAGLRPVRVTWRQLHQHPDALEADLRRLMR